MSRKGPAPEYLIETVADFGKVPPKRLRACLREFRIALEMHHGLAKALLETQRVLADAGQIPHSEPIEWRMANFRWIDDGERKANVRIRIKDDNDSAGVPREAPE